MSSIASFKVLAANGCDVTRLTPISRDDLFDLIEIAHGRSDRVTITLAGHYGTLLMLSETSEGSDDSLPVE